MSGRPLLSRLLPVLLLVPLALAPARGLARGQVLFELEDPKGDDDGAGDLIYPNRDDFQPGDLDLVRFSAEQRDDGVWFAVEMAQAIRDPVGRVTEFGQLPVDRLARHGFYTFNVDIYVDEDRVAGSGETRTVPGRGVAVDRQYAWERCIVLTPRPDAARTMLQLAFDQELEAELQSRQGRVSKEDVDRLQARSEAIVGERYFFPSRIRVMGRRIEFLVPAEFLGSVPRPSWGYTVLVTGVDLESAGRPGQLVPAKPEMMVMSVARGNRPSQFGIRGDADAATPPVVDLLAGDEDTQVRVLSDYDMVAGRLAAIPAVAPDGSASLAASGAPVTSSQSASIAAAASSGAAPTTGGAPAAPAERRTVPARLRTLNELLEQGLITQDEYNTLRRKILAEL